MPDRTIDDQIDALWPLSPGAIAFLAGYLNPGSIQVLRKRGLGLSPDRMREVAVQLRDLAKVADRMAANDVTEAPPVA